MILHRIHRTLRQQSRGHDVRRLQEILTDLGFHTGRIDGIFGRSTHEAVRAFQASRNLVADGIVGARTRQALASVVLPEEIVASSWVWLDLEPGPEATEASGVAIVNAALRQLHVHATGLVDPQTFRAPFNTYRAWLLDTNNQAVTTLRLTHCPTTDTWLGSAGTIISESHIPASVIVTPEANETAMPTGVEVLGGDLVDGIPVWPIGLENIGRAPDGTGFAFINQAQGLLAVFASGLGMPEEFGTDPSAQRPFDAFGVVLSSEAETVFADVLTSCLPGVWVGFFRPGPVTVHLLEVPAIVATQPLPLELVVVLRGQIIKPVKPITPRPLG